MVCLRCGKRIKDDLTQQVKHEFCKKLPSGQLSDEVKISLKAMKDKVIFLKEPEPVEKLKSYDDYTYKDITEHAAPTTARAKNRKLKTFRGSSLHNTTVSFQYLKVKHHRYGHDGHGPSQERRK